MPARRVSAEEKRAKGVHSSARSVPATVRRDGSPWLSAEPPKGHTGDARDAWTNVLANIPEGSLKATDVAVFERWCRNYALYRKLAKMVERSDGDCLITVDDKGNRKAAPEFLMMQQVDSTMLRLEKELGFTPIARTRVPAGEEKKDDSNPFEV